MIEAAVRVGRRAEERRAEGPGAELVAETIVRIATSRRPRLRYLVGGQAKFVAALKRFAPEAAYERGVRSTFRLDQKS
jgi:hypothetical protein